MSGMDSVTEQVQQGTVRIGRVVGSAGLPLYPTRTDHWAGSLISPTCGERFGTKVTYWPVFEGPWRALVISSPQRVGQRNYVIIYTRGEGSYPITASVRPEVITFGWHPDARGSV